MLVLMKRIGNEPVGNLVDMQGNMIDNNGNQLWNRWISPHLDCVRRKYFQIFKILAGLHGKPPWAPSGSRAAGKYGVIVFNIS